MEFFIAMTIVTIILLFGVALLYWVLVGDKFYKKNLEKAKRLYPEFYQLVDERNAVYQKFSDEWDIWHSAEEKIDKINEEMPYTPLESQSAKLMEIEYLKKVRLTHKPIADEYFAQSKEMSKEIDEIINNTKLLCKIYKGFLYT